MRALVYNINLSFWPLHREIATSIVRFVRTIISTKYIEVNYPLEGSRGSYDCLESVKTLLCTIVYKISAEFNIYLNINPWHMVIALFWDREITYLMIYIGSTLVPSIPWDRDEYTSNCNPIVT